MNHVPEDGCRVCEERRQAARRAGAVSSPRKAATSRANLRSALAALARKSKLELSVAQKVELTRLRDRGDPRATAVLLRASGLTYREIGDKLSVGQQDACKYVQRYLAGGLTALHPRRGRPPSRQS